MSRLRRYYIDGSYYFVTMVTYGRKPILIDLADDVIFTLKRLSDSMSFTVHGWVLLPDHIHMIIEPADCCLSTIIRRFKLSVAFTHRQQYRMRQGKTWQPRFWDHVIRDERDLNYHLEYIHHNPIKHGLVSDSSDWKFSSAK